MAEIRAYSGDFLLLAIIILLCAASAWAEDFELKSSMLGTHSERLPQEKPEGDASFINAEERLQLDLRGTLSESALLKVRGDILHDILRKSFFGDLREGYLDLSSGNVSFRCGKQITTWGVGDLLFINDNFPKNWRAFFSGMPMEYLKVGQSAVKTTYSSEQMSAELLLTPYFAPDTLPDPRFFFVFDPFQMPIQRRETRPEDDIKNTEISFKLSPRLANIDLSFYYYKGFFRLPSMRLDNNASQLTLFYPRRANYGLSLQGNYFDGVLSFEGGYSDSLEDRSGVNPGIPNSSVKLLLGYERQINPDFTVGLQYYTERMLNYGSYIQNNPAGFPLQKENWQIVTLRLTNFHDYSKLKLSLFTFYSPSDSDFMVTPEVTWRFSDNFTATLGSNIFGGEKDYTFFGQMNKNDNLYLNLHYEL